MAIFNVRKNGSGTHTDITSAYMAASSGDTIDIGEGTWSESIEVFKNNLTFVGASKETTIIQGIPFLAVQSSASVCSWTSGNNYFTVSGVAALPAFTVGMSVSESTSGANSPSGAQITSIDVANRKIYINKNFTTTLSNRIIKHWGRVGAIELRASGFTMSKIKVMDDSSSQVDGNASAIYIGASVGNQGASKVTGTSSTGFSISDCEFVAVGDYAMLSDNNAAVGNGTVTNCLFSGKTFSGVNSVAGAVRQGVVFQSANLPITFTNNSLDMVCGGMTTANAYSGNQVATIDAYGSTVTGNSLKGRAINPSGVYFNLAGLALRMRGGNATVSNNSIQGSGGFTTYGFLILPTYTNLSGKTIPVDEVVIVSNRYFKCTQAHLYASDKHPVTGASSAAHWNELTGDASQINALLIANGKANYQANSGTNITITRLLIAAAQASANSFITSEMGKDALKSISKVSSDAVFSNEANWRMVNFVFKHNSSSRRLVSSFRSNFDSSKKTKLKTNMKIGDGFQLHKIIISKSDRSHLVVKRSEIADASGFDFNLLADGPSAPTPPATPSLTAYQYIKLVFKEAWVATNGAAVTSDMTVSEIRMKWDDTAQSLTSLTPTTNIPLFYGTLLDIVNNVSAGGDYPGWASLVSEPFLLFNLGQQRTVQEILIAPQYGNASVSHNMPKKFDILGSNNGSDFTLISAVNQSNTDSWISGQYNVFDLSSAPTTGLIYTKDFGALNYAADLSFDTYTSWVLNGSTARAAGLGNLEMTLTNAAMLAGIIEGNSYIIRIYVASATGAGYLGGNLKGGYIDQNLFQFTNPLPPYYEQTVVAGAGASFRLDASNLPNSNFFEISKIEIFDDPSAPRWSRGIPANLGTYGTNGLTVLNNYANWDNGAQLATPLTGDFSYTMTHEILATGVNTGDIMFGYGHAVRDMSLGLTGLGSNRIIYMDQGFGFSNYGTGWVDTPNAVTFVNTPYAVTISRSGSTISWSIVGGVLNISGVAENGYTGDVYPIVAMYNKSRVNSFVIN